MKNWIYFFRLGWLLLVALVAFTVACPEPKLNPDQQVRPKITGDGPVLAFTTKVVEFTCGVPITKESILEKLRDKDYLVVQSDNENHSGEFIFEVADFTIPSHHHGYFDISFSVADSTGKKSDCTFAIRIRENLTPGTLTPSYDGSNLQFPIGSDPAFLITALLRKENSGLSVVNTNSCADAKGYKIIDGVFPADVGGHKYYSVAGVYPGVQFKIQDYLGATTELITATFEIIAPDQPPTINPPEAALEVNYLATVTDDELFNHLKTGTIHSIDLSVTWDNSTFKRLTVVDTTKTGVQRIYFQVIDKNGKESEKYFLRLNIDPPSAVPRNILEDPGFEENPADLTGALKKDRYRTARLSQHWKIVPTKISIRGNASEGGLIPNRELVEESTSCSDNAADYAQGPIILDEAKFLNDPNCSDPKDDGYAAVASKDFMSDLVAVGPLDHMLVYRATEKKKSGSYSFALRGKFYRPFKYYYSRWHFWGVGCALQQEVTLQPNTTYTAGAQIIKSFGHNLSSNHLDGMVGAIYIRVKKKSDSSIIKEMHIAGHPGSSQYGKFIDFETDSFVVAEETPAIFEIRRYLSNDTGKTNEAGSTWGYSPIYIDDCRLVGSLQTPTHIPEDQQLPPAGI